MSEIEVPTEHLHEHIHEAAEHEGGKWILTVALSSALLAVLAAVAALLAGHYADEAMLEQIQASDKWAYYQAKGIKSSILETRISVLKALEKPVSPKDEEKIVEYKKEQEEIKAEGTKLEDESHAHLKHHGILAKAVTFFQVAIALSAIAALTRRKWLFWGALGVGLVGLGFFISGLA